MTLPAEARPAPGRRIRVRLLSPGACLAWLREWGAESLWLPPTLAAGAAWVLARLAVANSPAFVVRYHLFSTNIDDARVVLSTIATAILTFTGVVFSVTLVALQMASAQYSPRLLRSFIRRPLTKMVLSCCIGTFVYSLVVLASLGASAARTVPAAAVALAYLLVLASVLVFVLFVHGTVRSMRVTYLIEEVSRETARALLRAFPAAPAEVKPSLAEPVAVLPFAHRDRVLGGLDVASLVRLARRQGCVLRLRVGVGAYLVQGSPLIEVHGGTSPAVRQVLACLSLAPVRTLYQDPAYGIRQLVDIAAKALSPAVNDPTTAVQVVDRLGGLLASVADRPDPSGVHVDDEGIVRLVRPVPSWERLADLALTEVERYGAGAPQVTRRLMALYRDLEVRVGPSRQAVLARHRARLVRAVELVVPDPEARERALRPDEVGLG
jgi:uncharacterized membrane protein